MKTVFWLQASDARLPFPNPQGLKSHYLVTSHYPPSTLLSWFPQQKGSEEVSYGSTRSGVQREENTRGIRGFLRPSDVILYPGDLNLQSADPPVLCKPGVGGGQVGSGVVGIPALSRFLEVTLAEEE